MMRLSIIAAMGKNSVIGKDGDMPWNLPDDLKYFKQKTMGHYVLMGRKTYLEFGRKLIKRKVILLTRQRSVPYDNVVVFSKIEDSIDYAAKQGEKELFIAGGGEIYKQTIDIADHLYLTLIHAEFKGDTFFPKLNTREWKLISKQHHPKDNKHQYAFDYLVYEKSKMIK